MPEKLLSFSGKIKPPYLGQVKITDILYYHFRKLLMAVRKVLLNLIKFVIVADLGLLSYPNFICSSLWLLFDPNLAHPLMLLSMVSWSLSILKVEVVFNFMYYLC